jgi:hypothetical protein
MIANVFKHAKRDVCISALFLLVLGLVFLIYYYVNPNKEAEEYFRSKKQLAMYHAMYYSFTVLWIASAVNFKYMCSQIMAVVDVKALAKSITKKIK